MEIIIDVEQLYKQYEGTTVLDGVSFQVARGEIFALLGANGAGKTTTLECMEGLRRYDRGTVTVRGKIGVQLQSASLPDLIRTGEALRLFAKWNGVQVDEGIAGRLGLDGLRKKQYHALSTGQKRRLHLALALTGDPDIIFLDEPTAGLDVEGRAALHAEIRALHSRGKTIVLASHDLAEVEALCSRLVILKKGRVAFEGTAAQLTGRIRETARFTVRTAAPLQIPQLKFCTPRGQTPEGDVYETGSLRDGVLELLTLAGEQGIAVEDLQTQHASLEEEFLALAQEDTV